METAVAPAAIPAVPITIDEEPRPSTMGARLAQLPLKHKLGLGVGIVAEMAVRDDPPGGDLVARPLGHVFGFAAQALLLFTDVFGSCGEQVARFDTRNTLPANVIDYDRVAKPLREVSDVGAQPFDDQLRERDQGLAAGVIDECPELRVVQGGEKLHDVTPLHRCSRRRRGRSRPQ